MKCFAVLCSIAGLAVLAGCGSPAPGTSQTSSLTQGNAVVLDVRTPEEFSRDHVSGAINIPVDMLQAQIEKKVPDKSTPLLVYCHSGRRAKIATEILEGKGYQVESLQSLQNAKSVLKQ